MAASAWRLFNKAKLKMFDGTLDLDTNSWKMALVTNAAIIHAGFVGASTNCVLGDFTQTTGTGYTAGGIALTVSLTEVDGPGIAGFSALTAGSGYTSAPTVSFSGGAGTGAAATANIDVVAGTVTGIEITNPGTGYTSAPTVSFSGGGGTSAAATAVLQKSVRLNFTPDPVAWTTSTFNAKYAVIYRSDGATLHALAFCDLELQKALGLSPSGSTLNVDIDATGIFDFS